MRKSILIRTLVILLALAVLLGLGGAWWLYASVQKHLSPPDDPPGQPSIASYAQPEQGGGETLPGTLVKDFSWDHLLDPPKSARPWTRWWWPGGDVDATTLEKQLALLDETGFGGGEVQPFLSGSMTVKDPAAMERLYSFDKPSYHQTLKAAMAAAASRGMQLDLTHFSGWPAGGPEINLEDSPTEIVYGETEIKGGGRVDVALPRPRPGPGEYIFSMIEFAGADFLNFPADHAKFLSAVAVRKVAGKHAWNVFNVNDTITLDPASAQVISTSVQNGRLVWNAPPGTWQVIVSYTMPSGEVPMGAAQKPQGFVVDPLRKPQVLGHYEYAFGARTGLHDQYGKGFRGIFNDSLEFRLKRMGVADMLQEFRKRRGYDLEPYLPAVYVEGKDNVYFTEILGIKAAPDFKLTDLDERIRLDYQRTLSDLVIERFVETSARWAQSRGLVSRGQSYGMDIDILRALGANTIPETEQLWGGGANVALKMASSAAVLYGKPLVSAESFVWVNRDFSITARRIKAAADKEFLAGINHIVYHGTPYPWALGNASPFGEEGWSPFFGPQNPANFSSTVGPGNASLWPDIKDLNTYIARSQNLLRQGRPMVDVLVYYPFLGFRGSNPENASPEALLNGGLPDADPATTLVVAPALLAGKKSLERIMTVPPAKVEEREAWLDRIRPMLLELDRHGISWNWVNDHAIQSGKLGVGTLTASDGRYQMILIPDAPSMEATTLAQLKKLATSGVPVMFSGALPGRQPGFRDAAAGDRQVKDLVQQTLQGGAKALPFDTALIEQIQAALRKPLNYAQPSTIQTYQRSLPSGGAIHFFANQSADGASLSLRLAQPAGTPIWWFDAAEGVAWPANTTQGALVLSLAGFESRFLITGVPQPRSLATKVAASAAMATATRKWDLTGWDFTLDGRNRKLDTLIDWRGVPELQHARGPGVYRKTFTLDRKAGAPYGYVLNLGLVQGSALVRVNGKDVARASLPPFALDVTDRLQPGDNEIEVQVLAPLRNVFIGKALAGDPKYSNAKDMASQTVAVGLMGPVSLAEVRR